MSILKYSCLALAAILASCGYKDSNFLNLQSATQPNGSDNTPPEVGAVTPAAGITSPVNMTFAQIALGDPQGSGVNPSTVSVSESGQSLPVTHTGNTFKVDLATVPDRMLHLQWDYSDFAGNHGRYLQNFFKKTTGPGVNTTAPATVQISGPTATIAVSGTIVDQYLSSAVVTVNRLGTGTSCGDAGNVPATEGSAAGNVSKNSFDVTNSAMTSNGSFSLSFTAYNAATTSSVPVTLIDCLQLTAKDAAVPQPNVTVKNIQVVTTSLPVASAPPLSITATYIFSPSLSQVCLALATNPARAGASYAGVLSQPDGTTRTFAGVLDNTGSGLARVNITQTGTYTASVTVGSLAATAQVNVTGPGGTCS